VNEPLGYAIVIAGARAHPALGLGVTLCYTRGVYHRFGYCGNCDVASTCLCYLFLAPIFSTLH